MQAAQTASFTGLHLHRHDPIFQIVCRDIEHR